MSEREQATPGYSYAIPQKIMTPDRVEIRLGPWSSSMACQAQPRSRRWKPGELELVTSST